MIKATPTEATAEETRRPVAEVVGVGGESGLPTCSIVRCFAAFGVFRIGTEYTIRPITTKATTSATTGPGGLQATTAG